MTRPSTALRPQPRSNQRDGGPTQADALVRALQRKLTEHKRAQRYHRDQAKRLRQRIDKIAAAAAAGRPIHINTQPQGGHGGNKNAKDEHGRAA